MPVVTIYFNRLAKLLGRKVSKEKIVSTLPFLGLDIEEEGRDHISVEYSPNRPDFSTDYGIALALQGLLGIKAGLQPLRMKRGYDVVRVDHSVAKIRPFLVAIEARDGTLDDETIRQVIAMQEDIHNGLGRRRRKVSIGIHDLDKVKFPLVYKTVERSQRIAPLGSQQEMTISEILVKTKQGMAYTKLLSESKKVPVIVDSMGRTISLPPIINSNLTEVTTKSRNLLVEVTAFDREVAEDALAVIAYALQNAGFKIWSLRITGPRNSNPRFDSKQILLDPSLVNGILGLDLSSAQMIKSLRKNRLDAKAKGKKILCTIPRYRTDVFGPVDLAEEVALGYGVQNLEPTIPPARTAGQKSKITMAMEAARETMVGLGYQEVMNFGLVGRQMQYDLTRRDPSGILSVADSKSQEHQILRDALLPGLVDTLSRNIHEPYPQKIFETGTVFKKASTILEEVHLAGVSTHNDIGYTEIKSVLQSFLKSGFDITCATQISQDPMFVGGRAADIMIGEKKVGVLG